MNRIILLFLFILITYCTITSGWKIINGSQAIVHEYPQIVSIKRRGDSFCGGTLLNGNTVLTAAHCVWDMREWDLKRFKHKQIKVYLGEYDLFHWNGTEKVFQVIKIIIHPSYRHKYSFRKGNDVALIKFDGYISNNQYDYIKYTELDVNAISKPGDRCEVVGWGSLLAPGEDTPQFLQKATVNIMSNNECGRIFSRVKHVRGQICAGSGRLSTSTCRGDSGGPLFCTDGNNRHIQVGIVSYGAVPCGKSYVPTVYARVSEFVRWIKANAN